MTTIHSGETETDTMDEPSNPPTAPADTPPARGGVDIRGGDVRAGHDIVAGDVNIAGDSISGRTVIVERGYSASEVQRLVLIVGALVFVTGAVFFVLGALSVSAVTAALDRPLPNGSSEVAALRMQNRIQQLNNLQPGEPFRVTFTEEELSSYFRFVLGPQVGVSEGKARLMDTPGQIAIGGNLDALNGRPFAAQLNVTTGEMPFQLQGAWLKVVPTPGTFGWVPVTPLARDLGERLNTLLFGQVQFTQVVQGPVQADVDNRILVLTGVAK